MENICHLPGLTGGILLSIHMAPIGVGVLLQQLAGPRGKGRREKKVTKVTYICRSPERKAVTCFILFLFLFLSNFLSRFFGRFVTRGVQKHDKNFFRKNPSGLITKHAAFFYSIFVPWLFCSIFFIAFLGRFVTRGVQKRDKKNHVNFPAAAKKKYLLTYVTFFFFSLAGRSLGALSQN
jgi:hypothetical protein